MDRPEQDREAILAAMGHLSHGVYVLGSRRGREMTAMTASWVAQVSERPPCVVVSVRDDRYTHDVILESATFSLSVLREDQVDVATHFAETSGEYHDKLHGVPYGQSPGGSPVLLACLAYLDSAAGFNRQPEVINGASDFLSEVFGERGTHARSAVGVSELPLDAPVEVELIVEVTLGS
jgi:hypothetical protein